MQSRFLCCAVISEALALFDIVLAAKNHVFHPRKEMSDTGHQGSLLYSEQRWLISGLFAAWCDI